jgi:precorrin-8X/cobalt-precorrin-8 methylmutase
MRTEFPESPPAAEIETRSFAVIDAEVPEPRPFRGAQWEVARRLVHTSADFQLLELLRFHPRALDAGVEALCRGATIVTDTEMARMGIPERRLAPLGARAICLLNAPQTAALAARLGLTRTAAAVDLAVEGRSEQLEGLGGCIMAIGNAPTALLRLLHWLRQGASPPALIVGMPVGFVNAAESKQCLLEQQEIPFITLQGRKGGSPLAAATCNALAELALRQAGAINSSR